ncbi:MAG: hypothetical protein K2Q22_16985 [Cytophagales bacterium]|nr:hypothetical protein [Cytophagales bacterium]
MQTVIQKNRTTESAIVGSVIVWGLLSFYAGQSSFFAQFPRPIFGFTVLGIQLGLIALYTWNWGFKTFADNIPLKTIALFHSWRIFAGWMFLAHTGTLSQTFINNAAYGDIIAGFLGLGVLVFGQTKRNYLIFNILGIVDFVIAVGTGLTLTIMGDNEMGKIIQLPLIMIPLFGVPLSGITHIISLNRLLNATEIKNNQVIY